MIEEPDGEKLAGKEKMAVKQPIRAVMAELLDFFRKRNRIFVQNRRKRILKINILVFC